MIRAIHPFGPRPGEYVQACDTDIRQTFAKARMRLLVEASTYVDIRDSAPEMLLTQTGAVFA